MAVVKMNVQFVPNEFQIIDLFEPGVIIKQKLLPCMIPLMGFGFFPKVLLEPYWCFQSKKGVLQTGKRLEIIFIQAKNLTFKLNFQPVKLYL